jgi:hypothetical protein
MQRNSSARYNGARFPAPRPPAPQPGPWDAPTAAFLADCRMYASMRADGPTIRFYEQMKAQARSTLPHLPAHQWTRLMDEVARICGVVGLAEAPHAQ